MKTVKKLSLLLLTVALLAAVFTTALSAAEEEEDTEPTYLIHVLDTGNMAFGVHATQKVKIGGKVTFPKENEVIGESIKVKKDGYFLAGFLCHIGYDSDGNGLWYDMLTGTGTRDAGAATWYSVPEENADPAGERNSGARVTECILTQTMVTFFQEHGASDIRFYPVWGSVDHTVTFTDERGASLSPAQTTHYNAEDGLVLPDAPDGFVTEGYEFVWTFGGTSYGPGETYHIPAYEDKTKVVNFVGTLIKKQNMFEIVYVTMDKDGVSHISRGITSSGLAGSDTGVISYPWGEALASVLTEPAPRAGFTFVGWYKDAACKELLTDNDTKDSYAPAYAKWTADASYTFRVAFEGLPEENHSFGNTLTVPDAPDALKDMHVGYTFGGWSTDGAVYTPGQTLTVESDMTLHATWIPVYHRLTISGEGEGSLVQEGATVNIGRRPKPGYTFLGWYDADGTLISADGKFAMPAGDLVLVARYEANIYTVTLDIDGKTTKHSVEKGKTLTLADAEKEGFVFLGWYLGDVAAEKNFAPTADVTLTAKFREITYTLTYKSNINGQTQTRTVSYKNRVVSLPEADVYEGYRFLGYTDEAGNSVTETVTLTGDTVLIAVYEAEKISVSWRNPVTNKDETTEMTAGSTVADLPAPAAPDGYRFAGWQNSFGEDVKDDDVLTAGTTLVAVFEPVGDTKGSGAVTAVAAVLLSVGVLSFGAAAFFFLKKKNLLPFGKQ